MKLSASLYSTYSQSLDMDMVKMLESYYVDYWHIDCNDDKKIFEDIANLNKNSDIPIDLHIITNETDPYIDLIDENLIDRVSFQVDVLPSGTKLPKLKTAKVGLAIQINHPSLEETIAEYENQFNFVLLMMTTPGQSGGQFNTRDFQKIRKLIQRFPKTEWCIDGGVQHEIAYILRLYGVESIVVGSFLMKNENIAQAVLQIQSRKVKSNYLVRDYMTPIEELPIVSSTSHVLHAIQVLDTYNMGIVFITEHDKLIGVITNADIRKKLVDSSYREDMPVSSMLNPDPKCINESSYTSSMIEYVESIHFPILVLPVVDGSMRLKGAVSFLNLLKEDF